MRTLRGIVLVAWTCAIGAWTPSVASSQGDPPLELDPDLDSIVERLGMHARGDPAIAASWATRDRVAVVGYADAKIKVGDPRGYALKYLCYLELENDRKLATAFANRALTDLAKNPVHLAEFIRMALYSSPTLTDFEMARRALAAVAPTAQKSGIVRVAQIRALLECNKIREAVIANKNIIGDLRGDLPGLLALAGAICDAENGRSMAMIAKKAIDIVIAKNGETEANLLVRFRVLHDLLGQEKHARDLGLRIVKSVPATDLNNWTWYLLTCRPSAGKYRSLALMAAHRLQRLKGIGYEEFDTIALAHYRNGRIQEAIKYQTMALKAGGSPDANYRRRMKKYATALRRKRLPPSPPAKKQPGSKK